MLQRIVIILTMLSFTATAHAMLRALNTAATGMTSQEAQLNTISNNIANANTTGFKQARTEFSDLLYETVNEAGERTSNTTQRSIGYQIGSGSRVSGIRRMHTQGNPQITNNPYDLMINGEGFFGIIGSDGIIKYTRDGSFSVDSSGNFSSKDGYKIFPGIVIPPNTMHFNVSKTGDVEYFIKGNNDPKSLGQIPVFTFVNSAGLRAIGGNLYEQTNGSGIPIQQVAGNQNAGIIQQGMIEASNVSAMVEMTNMIKAQRAFELNSKVMGVADQMLQTINNVR
ncbi:MAG: flagellar basal-body rod protein FlgG [Thermoproteota archaeon]|jgi:flagellar basal-body rod protein FlgG